MGLAGCASYEPLELPQHPRLAPGLGQLNLTLPSGEPDSPTKLDAGRPVTPDQVGLLAVVNNPELAAQRGKIEGAQAELVSAKTLPNPSLTFAYGVLVSGPATADSITASISQDIQSIVTYRPHVAAAESRFRQVGADALWQEWQVAQKARLLAIGVNADAREIQLREHALELLTNELNQVRKAMAAGNLALTALAPLIASEATAQRDLAALRLTELKDWQELDSLLGLQPNVRFDIAPPEPVTLPADLDALIETLPTRRPDLVALRLGYDAAEADVRAAILGQFPTFSLGIAGGSDTSQVVSLGPEITMDLPIFNRNQGKIQSARATRLELHAEYLARLDDAEGTARGLLVRARAAQANLARAREASTVASQQLEAAQRAFGRGNISQRDLADFQATALERQVDVLDYEHTLQEDALALSVELGLGFPQTMPIAPTQEKSL
jgi:outer membrane protein TolC